MRVALAAAIPLIFAVLLADQVMPPVVSQFSLEALLVPIQAVYFWRLSLHITQGREAAP